MSHPTPFNPLPRLAGPFCPPAGLTWCPAAGAARTRIDPITDSRAARPDFRAHLQTDVLFDSYGIPFDEALPVAVHHVINAAASSTAEPDAPDEIMMFARGMLERAAAQLAAPSPSPQATSTLDFGDGQTITLAGRGYAVRCAARIAEDNFPDARWALEVLNRYGHLVRHPADEFGVMPVPAMAAE